MIDYSNLASHGMTDDEMRELRLRLGPRPYVKKGRYGNVAKRTEYGGVLYDSKAEAHYAANLDIEVAAGTVSLWLRQVTVPLGPDFRTRVDFMVIMPIWMAHFPNENQRVKFVEVKGVETREFRKARKLWSKYVPFPLHVIKRGEVEIIEGKQ